ncbi:hypothetical protein BMF81_00720 [Nodularia spumigena UHCC 0039]|jgi:hypothetical protein|uniref:Uncharacterized protein n=2 Tax=Nodularia spumigena TaxID=70799 RepID=A0A2S0Q5U8_NODSP|nr:hypothetical protein BMF81_00720 [Nodularia spumigena UHCC 0039]EAW44771.1 hypothetical protein N9414_03021 [Nodularia spumigena CCY9414]
MLAHGITHILTFNPSDFRLMPDIIIVRPQELVPQGGSQKSKVKSQKAYKMGFSGILNGLFIYAVLY